MIRQGQSIEAGAASIAVFEHDAACYLTDIYAALAVSKCGEEGIVRTKSQAKPGRLALTHSEYDRSSGETHYRGRRPA